MRNNIVIFEGVDNTGKTNIAKEFCKRFPQYDYFKVKKEKLYVKTLDKKTIATMHLGEMLFYLPYVRQVRTNVVFDRYYPSEIVYGQLFRKIDEKLLYGFDSEFAKLGTKIVLLTKEDRHLRDDIFSKEQLLRIKKGYEEFAKRTKCKVLLLDTSSKNVEEQQKKIKDFILCQ